MDGRWKMTEGVDMRRDGTELCSPRGRSIGLLGKEIEGRFRRRRFSVAVSDALHCNSGLSLRE